MPLMGEDATGGVSQDRPQDTLDRLTVAEAAERLGVTQDAVRKRIARGTIRHDRDREGRVYVYASPSDITSKTDQDIDQDVRPDPYVRLLEDQVKFLQRELERRGEEAERLQRIVAGLTQANAQLASRVPELEAPTEAPGASEPVQEQPEGSEPRPGTPGPQEDAQRPWWRRVFGG